MFGYDLKPEPDLDRAIIKLITFFDLFDYPLTAYEIWINLDRAASLPEIIKTLSDSQAAAAILEEKEGFYFLSGRSTIIRTRARRYNYSCRKLKIARRWAKLFQLCPFVKLVALSNSFGDHNLRDGSDLDFFIITAAGRIWLSRLYCAGWAKILNRRPTAKVHRDRICLSFYISADHLNVNDLKLQPFDPYFYHCCRYFFPLFDRGGVFNQFLQANQSDAPDPESSQEINEERSLNLDGKPLTFLTRLESLVKIFQLKILPPSIREARNIPGYVVISDQVLKFHEHDKRQEILEKYGNKIQQVFSENN